MTLNDDDKAAMAEAARQLREVERERKEWEAQVAAQQAAEQDAAKKNDK